MAQSQKTGVVKSENISNKKDISPELVRAIADKVYDLFLTDLKLARERTGQTMAGRNHATTMRDRRGW